MVLSPISNQPSALLFQIPSKDIISFYKEELNMDVSAYFKDTQQVSVYQCPATRYKHFYPNQLAGDGAFYEQLQRFDWYYKDWKWDYDQADHFISAGNKVLDIGCGSGKFLKYLKAQKQCDCTGLELNEQAIAEARQKNLNVRQEFVQQHAEDTQNRYDVVCAFQVLEHIAEAGSFLEAAIKCLKPDGKLIICVPNNNPWFYQYDKLHTLNLPPHHMNMWDEDSLRQLGQYYGFRNVAIKEEPVSRYRFFARLKLKNNPGAFAKVPYALAYPMASLYTFLNRKNIKAGSILAVYSGLKA